MTKFKTPALKKLQQWAKERELGPKDLATPLCCDTSQAWRWLRGDARPSVIQRILLSQLTGGTVRELDWLTDAESRELRAAQERLGAA